MVDMIGTSISGDTSQSFTPSGSGNPFFTPTENQAPIFNEIGNQNQETIFTEDPVENAINQENILPKVDDGKGPLVVININADNADIDGDINNNPNVQTNFNDNTPNQVPQTAVDNPFIPEIVPTPTNTDNSFNLRCSKLSIKYVLTFVPNSSPEDVLTILDIMNDNRNKINNNNNNNNDLGPVFRICPAATVCVEYK